MRSFEEIPDIAERIKRSKMELQESGFYWAPEWDSQSCCDQDYVNNFKKGWDCRQTEVDELTLQVAEMKSRLNDAYTDGQSAMYTARQTEVDELNQELHLVLNNWNDLTNAIHARTNGTAVAEARQLYEKVDELQNKNAWLSVVAERENKRANKLLEEKVSTTTLLGKTIQEKNELQKRVDAAKYYMKNIFSGDAEVDQCHLGDLLDILDGKIVDELEQALKGGSDE